MNYVRKGGARGLLLEGNSSEAPYGNVALVHMTKR